jgi:dipeptidyl-peptidase-3
MRRGGRLGWAWLGAGSVAAIFACKSAAPLKTSPPQAPPEAASGGSVGPLPAFAPQPSTRLADVEGVAVLALAAPQFASLPRDQRLVAHFAAQAAAAGDRIAVEQGYRHNLAVIRLLRGILARPQGVSQPLLSRIRNFARLVYLSHGLHDPETGRKQRPPFSYSELHNAALAAAAAGADLGISGRSIEYGLRALEGPLFDPRIDPVRTVHGADLGASAVNLYEGVTLRDLQGFPERAPLSSRLVKQGGLLSEQVYRLPEAADALERALTWTAPPQRAVFEPLAAFFRSGDPAPYEAAQRAWTEAYGPIDAFLGFLDTSADPRGRKALFGGVVGMADPERNAVLERVRLRNSGESLLLLGAAGALRPPRRYALTLDTKSALFAAALDAAAQVRGEAVTSALADPAAVRDLLRCAASLRFAALAFRELSRGRSELGSSLDEALAQANAHVLAETTPALLPDPRCRELWPPFAVAEWLGSLAVVTEGDRIEDDLLRAAQLQIWWFSDKGAVVDRRTGGRRSLVVPDTGRFRSAARELLTQLQQIGASADATRWRELVERHASRIDPQWREELSARLSGIPRRVAVLPPRLDAVLDAEGKVVDAQALPVADLDEQMMREWAAF